MAGDSWPSPRGLHRPCSYCPVHGRSSTTWMRLRNPEGIFRERASPSSACRQVTWLSGWPSFCRTRACFDPTDTMQPLTGPISHW